MLVKFVTANHNISKVMLYALEPSVIGPATQVKISWSSKIVRGRNHGTVELPTSYKPSILVRFASRIDSDLAHSR